MAIIKAINSKSSVKHIINYVSDKEKTTKELLTGKDCSSDSERAIEDMKTTKELYQKEEGRQYKHFVQSFNPEDNISPEKANKIGMEWAKENFKGYEVFVATHTDKDHIHNHFVVNAVNFETGEKFRQSRTDLKRYKEVSDRICEREGLTKTPSNSKNITTFNSKKYKAIEQALQGKKKSYLIDIGKTVEKNIHKSTSKEHFINNMESEGYRVKWSDTAKNVTFEDKEGHKVRSSNLEETFKEEQFKKEEMLKTFENNRVYEEQKYYEKNQLKEENKPNLQQPQSNGSAEETKEKRLEIDDQEVREIQRSEGLSRVDEVTAQLEEAGAYDKKKESESNTQELRENEPIKTYTVEETGEKLHDLKSQYINLEKQINEGNKYNNQINENIRNASARVESLSNIKDSMNQCDNKIQELQEQRNNLGLFKVREKRELDESIARASKSREQVSNKLQNEFNTDFKAIGQKMAELKADLSKAREKTPIDVKPLKEQQQAISFEYKKEKVLAEQQLDRKDLDKYLKEKEPKAKEGGRQKLDNHMIRATADTKLNNISKEDKQKIMKEVSHQQANLIEKDLNNIKEKGIERER